MMCFVCMVHYCYSRGGEVIQALISHQGEHTWFIWAFSRQLLCLFFSFHFIMMTSKSVYMVNLGGMSIRHKLIAASTIL